MSDCVRVSVIVPVFNGSRYLRECLDSLASQNLEDIEFICVDDGSTDCTPAIMAEYSERDSRFRVISKRNTGYGNSMNVGIDAARGVFVGSVDSDDLVSPTAFKEMYELASAENLDFVKGDRLYFVGFTPEENRTLNRMGSRESQYERVFNPSVDPAKCMVKAGLPGLYRKRFLDECGIRLNETPGASFQDTGLTAQAMFNARRARLLDSAVYYVRRDNDESSSFDTSKVFCICEEHDFIREKARSSRGNVDACLRAAAAMRMEGYWWNVHRLKPEDRESFVVRAHRDFVSLADAGELCEESFTAAYWDRAQLLLLHPMEFYAQVQYEKNMAEANRNRQLLDTARTKVRSLEEERRRLSNRLDKAQNEIVRLKDSTTWKAGRAVTWLPRAVKAAARRSN